MKINDSFFYTLRENAKDEDSISGNLLVRAGMIKKTSAGIYMYMPLGLKVLKNIENIIREEMNNTGAQEVLMPALVSESYYEKSGRNATFGASMFRTKDRYNKPYALGPTHEELFTVAASMNAASHKNFPYNLYQIQTKFRDEARPRFGLIRVREFIMKDAYSFDKDEEGMQVSYDKMFNAYKRSFDRMGIDYRIVRADTGAMGGLLSEEFQAVTEIGEDSLIFCDECGFASNSEIAAVKLNLEKVDEPLLEKALKHTPNAKTIDEVAAFFNKTASDFVKTLIYKADDKLVAVLVRGDRELNETKLSKLLKCTSLEMASYGDVEELTHAKVGFAGPVGLDCPIYMDQEVSYMHNFIVGANQTDYHLENVNVGRDFEPTVVADLRNIVETDMCPCCGKPLTFKKGIEIGNTFKLGTKYSEAMEVKFLDENNKLKPIQMGCYGIGLGRCMAAVAEQKADEKGLNWPVSIAPYKVGLIAVSRKDEKQTALAQAIYDRFLAMGIEPIYDDRDASYGVKYRDMELIGIPCYITCGKLSGENQVEFKKRSDETATVMDVEKAIEEVLKLIKESC